VDICIHRGETYARYHADPKNLIRLLRVEVVDGLKKSRQNQSEIVFRSLRIILSSRHSNETYLYSLAMPRFQPDRNGYSRIIQCAEALGIAPTVLRQTYTKFRQRLARQEYAVYGQQDVPPVNAGFRCGAVLDSTNHELRLDRNLSMGKKHTMTSADSLASPVARCGWISRTPLAHVCLSPARHSIGTPRHLRTTAISKIAIPLDPVWSKYSCGAPVVLAFIRGENTFWGHGDVYIKLFPNGDPVQMTHDSATAKEGPAGDVAGRTPFTGVAAIVRPRASAAS
jgi:hypothetical protein